MKKLVIVLLCAIVVSTFSVTKIRFSFWGSPAELPPYQEIVKTFEAENPDIKVEIINYPWSTYFDKIQAMMAAEDAPDIMFLHTIPSWAAKGVLEDLTPYIEKSKFPVSAYNQELLSTFMYKGKIYGFPRDNDTTVLFYNKDLFDEAGVPYPDYSWDWQKFLDAARKLTKRDARGRVIQWGVVLERNKWHLWIHMNGGKIVDNYDNPTRCTLNERAAVEAIQFIADLILNYKVAPSIAELAQLGSAAELFTTGRVAMVLTNAAQINMFLTNKSLRFGVAPLPYKVTRSNTLGGAGFVMYSKSKNKDAAWKFMEFLCGPKGQAIFAKSGDAVPAMRTPETVKAFISNLPGEQERLIFFTETSFGVKFPQIPGWWEIFEYVTRELDYVWTGQKSAVEVLEYVTEEVNKMIKKFGTW
ncbi:MAG: sugar ABC transporter substrate-binding protein [Pseudothermotoga sp.]|nr:sugar ABC transporter substrate-binding protein [Pseudothermotoga sp.]